MPRSSFNFIQHESQDLCFDPSTFLKDYFSIDEFLRNHRNQATLEALRNDLGTYLKTLRLSMIELINKDYEDFVNLSKDLVGLNTGIEVLQGPLEQVRSEIVVVKNNLEDTITGLKSCLEQDRDVKEKKQSLFHLSQVILSLKKLDVLLKNDELTSRLFDLDLVERASTEYIMLQFSVSRSKTIMSRAQKDNSERLGRILMDILKNTFLECLCDQRANELSRCLRIFANLDKVVDVEELVRKEVIAPYLYDLVNEARLQKEPGGLKGIYRKVLEFADAQLSVLLKLEVEGDARFDFLVNGLWLELARRVEVHMGSVFAAGDPAAFHSRFTDTSAFLAALRQLCGSPASISALDSHPQTIHFMQKWNLLVYYKIRFQEIAGQLEYVLADGTVAAEESIYLMKVPATAIMCLQRCWDNQVFIPDIGHVFWRLSLQILARYCVWIKEETSKDMKTEPHDPEGNTASSEPTSRLNLLICLHLDTTRFSSDASATLNDVRLRLPSCAEIDAKITASQTDAMQELSSVLSLISDSVVTLLVRQSVGALAYVKDIPRLFRRTNRETPSKPCSYVEQIVQPLTIFYNTNQEKVPTDELNAWVIAVFSEITKQFHSSVNEVLQNAQKTEESLRRLKKAKDKFASTGESKGSSDDDKIRQQLVVDVHAYCKGIQAISIDPNQVLLTKLIQLVESARDKSERQ